MVVMSFLVKKCEDVQWCSFEVPSLSLSVYSEDSSVCQLLVVYDKTIFQNSDVLKFWFFEFQKSGSGLSIAGLVTTWVRYDLIAYTVYTFWIVCFLLSLYDIPIRRVVVLRFCICE